MSLAEFNAIQTGWTLQTVIDTVGAPGALMSQTDIGGYKTEMYKWDCQGGLGANALVMFQNGTVVSKSQFGITS